MLLDFKNVNFQLWKILSFEMINKIFCAEFLPVNFQGSTDQQRKVDKEERMNKSEKRISSFQTKTIGKFSKKFPVPNKTTYT